MKVLATVAAVAALLTAGTANAAAVFTVDAWIGDPGCSGASLCSNATSSTIADNGDKPTGSPLATFTFTSSTGANGIDWSTSSGTNTVGEFIKNGAISNFSSGLSQADFLALQMSSTGPLAAYFQIVGTYSGTGKGSISSDDGSSVYAGANPGVLTLVDSHPNPQSVETFAFNLPSTGVSSPFTVDYVEANGAPSVLDFSVSAAPEPATWALMFLGVFGIGAVLRSARRSPALASA